jgi:hypothetical protein
LTKKNYVNVGNEKWQAKFKTITAKPPVS